MGGILTKDKPHFASIDIGSHTIRLLIAELVNGTEVAPIRVERAITRLARNYQHGERLTSASMQQSIDVLKSYHELLLQYDVGTFACGATGVLRRAGNTREFLQNILTLTGLNVSVLSEKAEATLSAKGILSVLPDTPRGILLFDLGGSSTEFLLIDSRQPEPVCDMSVFIGAATITEKYLPGDPPKEESIDTAGNAIQNVIKPVMERLTSSLVRLNISLEDLLVVGTAGTVTTLAAIYMQMDDYKPYRVNGLSLSKRWLSYTVDRLALLPAKSRQGIPGLEKGREDIILGGALIVAGILDNLGQDQFTVTDAGLLEGLLLELIEEHYEMPQSLRTPLTWHWQKSRGQSLAREHSPQLQARRNSMQNKHLEIQEALTFDDVSLIPRYSEILPQETNLETKLTRLIPMRIPLLSAAMDSVTEADTAISIAREGGIGIIHRNMSIERQAQEVNKVKKSESGMIVDPVTVEPDQKISDVLELMSRYRISGVPVVKQGQLVGIITNRDLRFETSLDLKVSEVMTKTDLVTAPIGISLEDSKKLLHTKRIEKLLVVDEAGKLRGLITIKDIMKVKKYPNSCKDHLGRLRVGAAIGVGKGMLERARAIHSVGADVIVVDSAHGHSKNVMEMVKIIKAEFPQLQVVAGNVASAEGAQALIQAGADAIKVGVGPGSICTTRIVAGVGVPQITAISECAPVGRDHDVPIIADGGIKFSGDVVKALAAGANSVMIGSLFAGTDESPGETVLYQGRSYKVYRGMGSLGAMKEGSRDRYFQDEVMEHAKLVPEGIEGMVPYRGPIAASVHQLLGGLRSGMGYLGCRNLEELRTNARLVRVTAAGLRESHVHDVIITKEAPNYQVDLK